MANNYKETIEDLLIDYDYQLVNVQTIANGKYLEFTFEHLMESSSKIIFMANTKKSSIIFHNVKMDAEMLDILKEATRKLKGYAIKVHMEESFKFQRLIYEASKSCIGEGQATSLIQTLSNKHSVSTLNDFMRRPIEEYKELHGIGDSYYRVLLKVYNDMK